jgi:hypothetical protein
VLIWPHVALANFDYANDAARAPTTDVWPFSTNKGITHHHAWRPARRDPTLATHITKRGLLRAHPSFSFKADATLAARAAEVRALDDASATSTDTRTIRPPFARDVFAKRVKPRAARTHWSGCAHHCRFFCDS